MTDTTHPHQRPAQQRLQLIDIRYDEPVAIELIAELQAEYVVRYGGPDETAVLPEEFVPPAGAFAVAMLDGTPEPVGCGGLRRHDNETAEIKRMYVRATYRGHGLGRALLAAIERRAADLGYRRVILETGLAQPEAMALYTSAGYQEITGFGLYQCAPDARSYTKALAERPSQPAPTAPPD